MSNKLATQANVWYNSSMNIVGLVGAENTSLALINLYRRSIVTTVPLHAQDDNTPLKRCSNPDCENPWLPATTEYFRRNGNGLHSQCKECKSKKDKEYRERPDVHEQLLAKKKAYHSRADIRERRHTKDSTPEAREHRRVYRSQPEVREYERAYEEVYHSRPEIEERYRLHRQAYNSRPDIQERNRIYHSQPYVRAIYTAHSHNRRALKKNAPGTHTPEQIREQYERQKGKCYYCQHKVKWGEHHVDHVIPLTRGGSNDISNLVIACQPCNLSKNNKLPHEWPKGNRLL